MSISIRTGIAQIAMTTWVMSSIHQHSDVRNDTKPDVRFSFSLSSDKRANKVDLIFYVITI